MDSKGTVPIQTQCRASTRRNRPPCAEHAHAAAPRQCNGSCRRRWHPPGEMNGDWVKVEWRLSEGWVEVEWKLGENEWRCVRAKTWKDVYAVKVPVKKTNTPLSPSWKKLLKETHQFFTGDGPVLQTIRQLFFHRGGEPNQFIDLTVRFFKHLIKAQQQQQQQQQQQETGEKRRVQDSGFRSWQRHPSTPQNSPNNAKTRYSSVQFYRSFDCVRFQNFWNQTTAITIFSKL